MTNPKIMFDYHAKARYVTFGNYTNLLPHIHFKTGIGTKLDKLVLYIQSCFPLHKKSNTKQDAIVKDIHNRVNEPITSMILYDTSWYKECQYIGFLKTQRNAYFIRYFRQPEDIVYFHHQNQLIHQYFHGIFSVVPVSLSSGNVVLQPLIPKKRDVKRSDHIEDKIIYYTQKMIRSEPIQKDIRDILPIDFFLLCALEKKGNDLPVKVREWLDHQHEPVPIIPVHGDMTPWNIIINRQEQAVLIDYERAGWHVPYYDLFHYVLQNKALEKSTCDIIPYLNKRQETLGYEIKTYLILYLIDQIHYDLNSKKQFESTNVHISRMVDKKIIWLRALIDMPHSHDS